MPAMANITVKKNDGTTDIVYTAKSPSAGDSVPAVWRADSVGSAPSHRPELRLMSKNSRKGGEEAREMRGTYKYPQLVTDTNLGGLTIVKRDALMTVTGVIPKDMPAADINEFVSQAFNLFVAALLKDSFKDGFAPQ
nr:MAG: coat protein [Leviviridae sp.]